MNNKTTVLELINIKSGQFGGIERTTM